LFFLFSQFCGIAKLAIHQQEDLAKFGYKPDSESGKT
jgi:hypothetical protein